MRKPLMAGNWKMNLHHLEAIRLVQKLAFALDVADYDAVEVVVLPPYTDLRSVQTLVDGDRLLLRYGAQDLSPYPSGAYTGDVGGPMLAKLGCSYVVVGHSERRQYHHEDDGLVNAKAKAALAHGITPIVCVSGLEQVEGSLDGLTSGYVVAYEPVWAIGTGQVATPEHAQEVCAAIRERVGADIRILYGGSVKAGNIAGLMAERDIDGALVGGASLDAEEFALVCRYRRH